MMDLYIRIGLCISSWMEVLGDERLTMIMSRSLSFRIDGEGRGKKGCLELGCSVYYVVPTARSSEAVGSDIRRT